MIIKSMQINNYKSIKDIKNILYIDRNITTIIGKNESGKSNVIEAIGNLPLKRFVSRKDTYFQNKNRDSEQDEEVGVTMTLVGSLKEDIKETQIIFKDITDIQIKGGLSDLILNETSLIDSRDYIIDASNNSKNWKINYSNSEEVQRFKKFIDYLKKVSVKILTNYNDHFQWLRQKINKDSEKSEKLRFHLDNINSHINLLLGEIPSIFYRENLQILKSNYTIEEIKEEFKDEKSILKKFMKVIKLDEKILLDAFNEEDIGRQTDHKRLINQKVIEHVNNKFNVFYTQEKIELDVQFHNTSLHFLVRSNNGNSLAFTERSNGLKWYLSLFIDLYSEGASSNNLIILLDEPGSALHVNAQKELINLFNDLTKDRIQLIYTTHSPSMIDSKNLSNIRAIEKENENTIIYNNVYNQELSKRSKMETLSPLIQAIGADQGYLIGPSRDTLNLITEGMSDYYYLKAVLKQLELEDDIYILPSIGASNVNKLVSVMIGWGCSFKVLLDFDQEGFQEYNRISNSLDKDFIEDKIIFVNGENCVPESEEYSTNLTIEDILEEELVNDYPNLSKTLKAKMLYEKVDQGEYILSDATMENFGRIIDKLNI